MFQNSEAKMTKEDYFDMCEMMGTQPVDSEIPVEISDFPIEFQTAFEIYYNLQDHWEGMSGTYMGKNTVGIGSIFDIFEIPIQERRTYLEYISLIDSERIKTIENKRKQEDSLKSKKSPN